MHAVRMVQEVTGLHRMLLCGVSKKAWHYALRLRSRNVSPDPEVQ